MTETLTPQKTGHLDSALPTPQGNLHPKIRRGDSSLGHFWLVQREGRFWDRGRVLSFEPHLSQGTLGRSLSCIWRLNDPSVSRLHAALIRKPKRGVYIVDLGSRRGTFVNGQRVETEMLLMDGDRLRLGDSTLEFTQEEPQGIRPQGRMFLTRTVYTLGALAIAVLAKLIFA